MDVLEYWRVLRENRRFFWMVVGGLWFLSFVWLFSQPASFQGTLLLNIGRSASAPTEEYSYDNFYRLQADERFADTVVRWLSNPRIVSDILGASGSSPELYSEQDLSGQFTAKRLSSQVIEVRYTTRSRDAIARYAEALVSITQKYTESLNPTQANWFRIVGSEPIVRDARVPAWPFLLITLAVSFFVAFWAVLIKHFFSRPSVSST